MMGIKRLLSLIEMALENVVESLIDGIKYVERATDSHYGGMHWENRTGSINNTQNYSNQGNRNNSLLNESINTQTSPSP